MGQFHTESLLKVWKREEPELELLFNGLITITSISITFICLVVVYLSLFIY